MALNSTHAAQLEARGIDLEMAARFGIVSSSSRAGNIEIPYLVNGEVVNHKYRTLDGEKRFSQDSDALKCFWNFDVIGDQTLAGEPLIITEGEMDALIAIQCGFPRTVSVPDGAPAEALGAEGGERKYGYLEHAANALKGVQEIIIATDGDGPGVNLLNDLALRLMKARCKWVRYPKGCKDLNDAFNRFGERGVKESIARAQWMAIPGVYRMSELPPVNDAPALDCGIVNLHRHYKLRLGDFAIFTGIPGHGKTTFVNEVCCRMAERFGTTTVFASFEQKPQTMHRRNLRTFYHRKLVKHQTPDERDEADLWIDHHFSFIVPSDDDDVDLEWVLERCAASVIRHGAKIVVIDPWNEMDHARGREQSLTEYTGWAIRRFKRFASKYQVHLIVVAHPVKQKKQDDGTFQIPTLYDISDSQHWYNKADVGGVIHRKSPTETIIRIAKVRDHEDVGEPGDLIGSYNRETGRYTIVEDDVWANR